MNCLSINQVIETYRKLFGVFLSFLGRILMYVLCIEWCMFPAVTPNSPKYQLSPLKKASNWQTMWFWGILRSASLTDMHQLPSSWILEALWCPPPPTERQRVCRIRNNSSYFPKWLVIRIPKISICLGSIFKNLANHFAKTQASPVSWYRSADWCCINEATGF